MAKVLFDDVWETSTTTGTGAYTLAGAVVGYQSASAAGVANGDTFEYSAKAVDSNGVPTGDRETGLGTWATGGVLTRTTIYSSSNAGAAVNWGAGTKRIALTLTATGVAAKADKPIFRQAKTGAYTVVAGDNGTIIDCTSGTFTVSLTDAATLGDGFNVEIVNLGSGTITVDPNGAETLDGHSTLPVLKQGAGIGLICTGTAWVSRSIRSTGYGGAASGYNTVQIGNGALVVDTGIAIGNGATATGPNSLAIGQGSGIGASATGGSSIAVGYAIAGSGYSTAIGQNSSGQCPTTATGAGAMALGGSYASGTDSFAAAIGNNTSSYGAQGASSVAIGQQCKVTGSAGVSIGYTSISNSQGFCFGISCVTSAADTAVAIGDNCTASGKFAVSMGRFALASLTGKTAYSAGRFADQGDAQTGKMVLRCSTTDGTATVLTSDAAAGSTTNQVVLPNSSAYTFHGLVTARQNTTGDTATWDISGGIKRGANATATALVGTVVGLASGADAGAVLWTAVATADTTNGGLKITCTGEAAKTIRWSATIFTNELSG